MTSAPQPTRAELLAAAGRTIADVIAPGLRVLFCGINPGLYSGVTGHHFARPGNRFWPALHAAGFTPRRLAPSEQHELLGLGYGITNLVERATARADELAPAELIAGGARLHAKIAEYRPRVLAVLGVTAYRTAFGQPRAALGRQPTPMHGTIVWIVPNPSGLNAHYQLADLARVYGELRLAAEQGTP
ncbi:MAG: G/U mismatch-specific DNA glycosylase [Kouleothrix sp.]|jgi:TDG/mug DNA glycosylase family protein|nr:G/U mismatch-specific DNA glycosylase [Kouleothrix sp.]